MEFGRITAVAREIVRFEKKKLILPLLVCLILLWTVTGIYYLRGQEVGKEVFGTTDDAVAEQVAFRIEYHFFNERINVSERRQEVRETVASAQRNRELVRRTDIQAFGLPLIGMYRVPGIPLVPQAPMLYRGQQMNSYQYRYSVGDGYVLSPAAIEQLTLSYYRVIKLDELAAEINQSRSAWTLNRFRDRVDTIMSQTEVTPEVREAFGTEISTLDTLRRPPRILNSITLMHRSTYESLQEPIRTGAVHGIQWYHFLPAFIATFLVWYLINSMLVVGLRGLYRCVHGHDVSQQQKRGRRQRNQRRQNQRQDRRQRNQRRQRRQ